MRNLKLPRDTKPGTSIYRLRGFDADGDALTFNIRGTDARELLEVRTVSPTQADVILKIQPVRTQYEYTIFVSDGKETSLFPSTIVFTEAKSVSSPFLEYEPIISLLENTPPNQVISYVVAKEKENSNLPVSFELQGSDKFTIKYVFGPRGSSKAELKIVGELDFEEVNYVKLNILALNAWTNVTLDTRNIATVDIVILVQDIQDSPPVFQNPPSLVTISDTLKSGAALVDIRAEDGDTANKNNITYSIDSESSLGSFFSINSTNGTITLLKSVEELRSQYDCCIPLLLEVKATEVSSSQPAETTVKVPFLLEKTDTASSYYSFGSSDSSNTINQPTNKISNQSTINRAPRFTSQSYVGTIPENSPSQTAVRWEGAAVTRVIDDDKGDNAMFELF
ncbi:cadherin-86C-like [Tachypleus tridentatus]|uniref:cadherin-86C-like n=1 Tax=Tachypleus tridentatus TaxID=6853 RepID=UPI003FCFDCF1